MASPVDVVIKFTSNVADSIRNLDRVGDVARRAGQEVDKASRSVDRLTTKIGSVARARGGSGLGAAAGTLAAGGSFTEALGAGLGAAVPELATAALGYQIAGQLIDRFSGAQGASDIQKRLEQAGSLDEAIAILRSGAKGKAHSFGFTRGLRSVGDVLTGKPGALSGSRLGGYDEQRELRKAFRAIAESNPALAAAMLAEMGNPADLAKIMADVTATRTAHQAFLAGLAPRTPVTNVTQNIYTAFDGLGGRNAQGRQVRSVLDARDRNNGRYQPSTRR